MIKIKRPGTMEQTPAEVRQDIGDNLPPEIATSLTRRAGYHYKVGLGWEKEYSETYFLLIAAR